MLVGHPTVVPNAYRILEWLQLYHLHEESEREVLVNLCNIINLSFARAWGLQIADTFFLFASYGILGCVPLLEEVELEASTLAVFDVAFRDPS